MFLDYFLASTSTTYTSYLATMAATPMAEDAPPTSSQERRNGNEDGDQSSHDLEPVPDSERDTKNGTASATEGGEARGIDQDVKEDYRSDAPGTDSGGNAAPPYREKQVKVLSFFSVSTILNHDSWETHSARLLLFMRLLLVLLSSTPF